MDIQILLWFQSIRSPALDALMEVITQFGEETLLIAAICLCYWCVDKRLAQFTMFSFFLIGMTGQLLKIVCMVPRPWVRDPRVIPVDSAVRAASGYSFPSGHTACATAAYGSVFVYKKGRAVRWLCAALIALVGVSRLYLGVHTPQDVIASWAIGALILLFTRRLFGWADRTPGADARVLGAGLALCAAALLFALLKPYPAGDDGKLQLDMFKAVGAAMGMLIGWFWERRRIGFDARAGFGWQAVKYGIGALLLMVILFVPWPFVWMPAKLAAFARYGLVALTAVGAWPWAFTRLMAKGKRA